MPATIDIRRSNERFHTRAGWLDSRHSFSFSRHYDPANTHHGLLVVHNDDVVLPDSGFTTHPHRDMEIVTWVLEGRLEHTDTLGNHDEIYPGLAQRMSAGTGIWHSEMNPSRHEAVRFVQMWVVPDTEGIEPGYEQLDISHQLDRGELVTVASGDEGAGAIGLRQRHAELRAGRLAPSARATLPEARHVHLYVARGAVDLETGAHLGEGDAARLSEAGGLRTTAGPAGAEVLVWATA